jgi:cobalamin transport system substrate-binding protein
VARLRTSLLCAALLGAALVTLGPSGAGAAVPRADDPPQKIISLSPTATEMLFAIGAGKQLIAVDDQSSFPERAPRTDLSGYTPNVEAIAGYDPDLVVLPGGQVKSQLTDLGIVVLLPAAERLSDSYTQISELGKGTGRQKAAKRVVSEMRADIANLSSDVPDGGKRPTAYYELDDTYFSADSSTFIGRLLRRGGFDNIADGAKAESPGYPQLSSEAIVDADPDAVFLADSKCCGQSADTFGSRPGFEALTAATSGNVVTLDDDVASRWGPRVVELLRQIVKERKRL